MAEVSHVVITVDIKVTPKKFSELYSNGVVVKEDKLYLRVFRRFALFSDNSESFSLDFPFGTDLKDISKIYVVSDGDFPSNPPQEEYLLEIWRK